MNGTTSYQAINARTIDVWCKTGWEWGRTVDHEIFSKAKEGVWDIFLTPLKPVPHDWLDGLQGEKILGLATGGGQ